MDIGGKIKQIRTSKMMTQAELAGEQITRNMLSNIERGTALPSLQTVIYLAGKLNVPVGFLLADGTDEFSYRKMNRIANIREAYRLGNFKDCRSMCTVLGGTDDETALIISECDLAIAKEEIEEGKLHSACRFLDEAVEYAGKTVYRTDAVRTTSALLFRYLGDISQTLYSEITEDTDILPQVRFSEDPFAAYLCAYLALCDGDRFFAETYLNDAADDADAAPYVLHVGMCLLNRGGQYRAALDKMNAYFDCGGDAPIVLRFRLQSEAEIAYRELGDYKNAYESTQNRLHLQEQLLEGGV